VLIRQELLQDHDAIDAVHRAAFRPPSPGVEPVEARLVRELRDDAGWVPALSLVAEGTAGEVVGHVVCTEGGLAGVPVVGLGPIGVLPDHQGGGVGAALMHAVLAAADALGYPAVALLGHLDYYPRFGFVAARSMGIVPPDPAWGDAFQARPLRGWSSELGGEFRYAGPFERL
jgi:putative acetyltransferase